MKIMVLSLEPPSLIYGAGGISRQLYYMLKAYEKNHEIMYISPPSQRDSFSNNVKFLETLNIINKENLYDSFIKNYHSEMDLLYSALNCHFIPDVLIYADIFTFTTAQFIKHKYPHIKTIFLFSLSHSISNKVSYEYSDLKLSEEIQYSLKLELNSCLFADNIVVNSNWIFSFFPIFKPIHIIPNCINMEHIKSVKKSETVYGKKKFKIAFMQRLTGNKGINHLLSAKIPENVDLIFMGKTIDLKTDLVFSEICRDKGHTYLGKIEGDKRYSILKSCDFSIFPNIHEPFCISLLESVACDVIPIYTNIPGMGQLFGDIDCGIKIETGKDVLISNIEKGILRAIEMTEDEKTFKKQLMEKIKKKYSDLESVETAYLNLLN